MTPASAGQARLPRRLWQKAQVSLPAAAGPGVDDGDDGGGDLFRRHVHGQGHAVFWPGKIGEALCGLPVKVCEMLAQLDGPEYIARVAANSVKNVLSAKKAIEKAFRNQTEGRGFSLVEVLSACPTNWGMTPADALKWMDSAMIPYYPLGVYKDKSAKEEG